MKIIHYLFKSNVYWSVLFFTMARDFSNQSWPRRIFSRDDSMTRNWIKHSEFSTFVLSGIVFAQQSMVISFVLIFMFTFSVFILLFLAHRADIIDISEELSMYAKQSWFAITNSLIIKRLVSPGKLLLVDTTLHFAAPLLYHYI